MDVESVWREPTDFSPVERVDAAGGAVVHQSCFGSAEGERSINRSTESDRMNILSDTHLKKASQMIYFAFEWQFETVAH